MIRLADYVAETLVSHGIRHVFMLTGGGAMHLNDAIGGHPGLSYICNHHEQACAIGAEGYARTSEKMGAVCVTTGPGGTNTMTGVLGQWLDSIPVIYISGQVRYDNTVASTGLPLRQLGDQEANIIEIVRSITKYAVMVTDPYSIRYHLEKALRLAVIGRPGPVWVDIPLNVQASQIDETKLAPYDPQEDPADASPENLELILDEVAQRLMKAERPVILAGQGIRLAGAVESFHRLAQKLGMPIQVAWNGIDLFPSDHPLYAGRPSTLGQRAANFIFQNADLLLNIGCRLNTRQIGYTFKAVARAAYKISVDIDPIELQKPTLAIDLPVHCDAKIFIDGLLKKMPSQRVVPREDWLAWCREKSTRYPLVLPEYRQADEPVNPYVFTDSLSECLDADDVIVSSNGASCVVPIQTLAIKAGQRYIVNSGCAAMGYGLPSAVGACFARGGKRVICLEGDGSIQLNIQELQTAVHHRLPLKIFIFNNGGYLSIRTTQSNYFQGHLVGESAQSGVSFPDMVRIGEAYGIPSLRIQKHSEMKSAIQQALNTPGPFLCDVWMSPEITFSPRVASRKLPDGRMISSPLEDMYPFLDREEFRSNMIIPPWEPN